MRAMALDILNLVHYEIVIRQLPSMEVVMAEKDSDQERERDRELDRRREQEEESDW